jgi:hypothetical protein
MAAAAPLLPTTINRRKLEGLESECYRRGDMNEWRKKSNWARNAGPPTTRQDATTAEPKNPRKGAPNPLRLRWNARNFPNEVFPVPPDFARRAAGLWGKLPAPTARSQALVEFRGRGDMVGAKKTAYAANLKRDFTKAWTGGMRFIRLLGQGGQGVAALCEFQNASAPAAGKGKRKRKGGQAPAVVGWHKIVVKVDFQRRGVLGDEREFLQVSQPGHRAPQAELVLIQAAQGPLAKRAHRPSLPDEADGSESDVVRARRIPSRTRPGETTDAYLDHRATSGGRGLGRR